MNAENFNDLILDDILRENLEDAVEQMEIRRDVLPQRDPFLLSDHKFIKLFRVSKDLCQEIVAMLTPYIVAPTRRSALTVTTKVLAALRFYASGSYQEITGSNCSIAISQASMSRCTKEVTNAFNRPEILSRIVHHPSNIEELEALRTSFYNKFRFPGAVGCIDCTHISIVAPQDNEHIYIKRKGYHSLNIQLAS